MALAELSLVLAYSALRSWLVQAREHQVLLLIDHDISTTCSFSSLFEFTA